MYWSMTILLHYTVFKGDKRLMAFIQSYGFSGIILFCNKLCNILSLRPEVSDLMNPIFILKQFNKPEIQYPY